MSKSSTVNIRNGLKKSLILLMTAAVLCGCGTSEEPAVPAEDPVPVHIVTTDVESVSVRYFIGYNIAAGDEITQWIPCHTLDVTGDDLEKISVLLSELTEIEEYPDWERSGTYDWDNYELTINDDLVLHIGYWYGSCPSARKAFAVPADLYDILYDITEEYNRANVLKSFDTDHITVTDRQNRVLEITDPDQLESLLSFGYYVITRDDASFAGERMSYRIDLHNGDELVLYSNVIGKLYHEDGNIEHVYVGYQLEYDLENIFAELD